MSIWATATTYCRSTTAVLAASSETPLSFINYNGGAGSNTLFLEGTPAGTTVTNDLYNLVGPVGSGLNFMQTASGLFTDIAFDNVGLAQDSVPGPLGVVATFGDNAINVSGAHVIVDSETEIAFAGKTDFGVGGSGGDDTFNVNLSGFSGFSGTFSIFGNDPTASDKLIVNGTAARRRDQLRSDRSRFGERNGHGPTDHQLHHDRVGGHQRPGRQRRADLHHLRRRGDVPDVHARRHGQFGLD